MDTEPYGFIYCTTNLVNGRKYIGQHKYCGKIDKYYLGSGVALANAIKKYGRENFKREIICECFSLEELNEKEVYYINLYDAINNPDYYNIAQGGNGGFGNFWWQTATEEQIKKANEKRSEKMSGGNNPFYGKQHTLITRAKMSAIASQRVGEKNPFYGKTHTEEFKKKFIERIGDMSGENNPFYGKKHTKETKEKIKKAIAERTANPNYVNPKSFPVILEDLTSGEKKFFTDNRRCFAYLEQKNLNVKDTKSGKYCFAYNTFRGFIKRKTVFSNMVAYYAN